MTATRPVSGEPLEPAGYVDPATYQRVVGDELRRVRLRRGWTRRQLRERLRADISLQTLATYELGTRSCSIHGLAELCLALDIPPHEVLARAHQRLTDQAAYDSGRRLRLDLVAAADVELPELAPLRAWATQYLAGASQQTRTVPVDRAALDRLAEVCRLDTAGLLAQLRAADVVIRQPRPEAVA
jgi:transcriptional regulator with XRE-family HTH domain